MISYRSSSNNRIIGIGVLVQHTLKTNRFVIANVSTRKSVSCSRFRNLIFVSASAPTGSLVQVHNVRYDGIWQIIYIIFDRQIPLVVKLRLFYL